MKYDLASIDETINDNQEESEVGKIIRKIRETGFSLNSKEELLIYVQNHQLALINKKKAGIEIEKFDEILFNLETYFWDFLKETLPVSELGKQALIWQTENAIKNCKSLFADSTDPKLFSLIDELLNPANANCTIQNCNYIKEFWESWSTDFIKFCKLHDEENLIAFLISQNFNSPHFFVYITDQIKSEMNNEDNPINQKIALESFVRRFSSAVPCKSLEYRVGFQNISDLIINWVNREMKYCLKRQRQFNPEQTVLMSSAPDSSKKIETSLSVPQLACLFKMLSKSGIITNMVKTEMLESVSKSFKTKKAEVIALESLHNKYYNMEDKTRETVKQLLQKVLLEN